MKWLYVGISYFVIAVIGFFGIRFILHQQSTITLLQESVVKLEADVKQEKESKSMLIEAYNAEIAEIDSLSKQRKIVVKEIVKSVKGSDDEKCINSRIPSVVFDKLRNNDKK